MTPDQLFAEFVAAFDDRKFSAGLLMAFIDFYKTLDIPALGAHNCEDVIAAYPKRATTAAGQRANTLIVSKPDGTTLSLRPFYNAAERFFHAEHKRFDYPSCAPHATQVWADYVPWLDSLATYSHAELDALRSRVATHVLDTLPSQAFDPASVRQEPPLFRLILEEFDMTRRRGEKTGAAYQGIVFGFLRADNPHLQIEIDKVRTGSRRLQRVGDIDGWDGARLALSAEVKQFEITPSNVPHFADFANATGARGALGIVAALGYRDDARQQVEALGLKALTKDDLVAIVELWDPLKQHTAVSSFVYYVRHVEKNSVLAERLDQFLAAAVPDAKTPATGAVASQADGDDN
jgi:hypothetical protein